MLVKVEYYYTTKTTKNRRQSQFLRLQLKFHCSSVVLYINSILLIISSAINDNSWRMVFLSINPYIISIVSLIIFIKNPDLHTAPKQSIIKSLQIRSDIDEQSEQIKETNTVG